MKKHFDVPLDDMMVVEGCIEDDKTVLGGRKAFFNHFCTFFEFSACYAENEYSAVKKLD